MAKSTKSALDASSKRRSKNPGKEPPLSEKALELLKVVEEDVVRLLAERKIDTSIFSGSFGSNEKKKENAQNVRNRQCQIEYTAQIERAEAEAVAWAETDRYYDSCLAELIKIGQPNSMSAKAKGKQRAISQDLDDYLPRVDELPEHFRGVAELALKVLAEDPKEKTPMVQRLEDLQLETDSIYAFVNTAAQCTNVAESNLNHRFALLSLSLALRSQLPQPVSHVANASDYSTYLPPSLKRPELTTDPQELLRALSRMDAERPPAQVGDAARRAIRQVQRANETGLSERRLTGVSPPTPRKLPGTPRRPTTPGREH